MALFLWVALAAIASAQSYLAIFGGDAENKVYHFFIDESEGETSSIEIDFYPNDGAVTEVEIYSNLNRRDFATLGPDFSQYWLTYPMNDEGGGHYSLTLPVEKCGSYDITARYQVNGDPEWRWYGGRNAGVVVSDVATRDLIVYEMQAHVVDATGDSYETRSTFPDLYDGGGFALDNWNMDYMETLGVNCIWLQPFHPVSENSCNYGTPGSPYSIKNLFEVAGYLASDGTRATAMTEFQNFVNAADAKGISVISDVIFNHLAPDTEIARDPSNPSVPAADPFALIKDVRPQWFSRYVGTLPGDCPTDKNNLNHGDFLWWEPAQNGNEIGPAPADRHDFMWPDAFDLFWGTYSALGNISNTDDAYWNYSSDVQEMAEYYAYFIEHWLAQTGNKMGGFRCDFAQGIPRRAWQYLINRAKSIKPELYFVAESLDGGSIAYRAWKGGFDALNENQLWAIVQNENIQTTDLRAVIDQRKNEYGFALILRGTINHDQGPWIGRKWDACAMHSVFCAIDGTPQLYQGQPLGYEWPSGQFSQTRVEFGREIPNIRVWHNFRNLQNNPDLALWYRYADASKGRQRAEVLRLANQYYLDQVNNYGPHQKIFSVLKYENFGWDPADQEVVLAFVNLQPGTSHAGTFNIDVEAISLNPTKTYNVKNLASSTPDTKLWATPRSGSDLAANGLYVEFSSNPGSEGSVAQYLLLEEDGGGTGGDAITTLYDPTHYPGAGDIDAGEDFWVDIQSTPIGAGEFGKVVWSTDGANWNETSLSANGTEGANDKWHALLGTFSAGTEIQFAVQVVDKAGTEHWKNNGGVNYTVSVNDGGNGDPVQFIGHTSTWPTDGNIESDDDLWIDTQTWPTGTAAAVEAVYTTDGGANWQVAVLTPNGLSPEPNDKWHVNLGTFPPGTEIQFAVNAQDNLGNTVWDNNGGADYMVTVNGSSGNSSVEWIGNARYQAVAEPGVGSIGLGNSIDLEFGNIKNGALYSVICTTDLVEWVTADTFTGSGNSAFWDDEPLETENEKYYSVQGVSWPFDTTVLQGDDLVVQIQTYPTGSAASATIVYTTSGSNWTNRPMTMIGQDGDNDVWEVNLGSYPPGITVQYAIEVKDGSGVSTWDNNGTANFHVPVIDPNAPDTTPPTVTYTPEDTTTSDAMLDVELFASDDTDPTPTIYYTTDGSDPDTNDTIYAGVAITVTDAGAGVDMTIKALAEDASGNVSGVTTIEVKVNESFVGGPTEPYSINPTLGQAVANGGITIDGNPGDWDDNKIIALDMANDHPGSLGSNWTMHETAIDFTHLWAAWDDNNLYLAWQLVDVRDKIDPTNAGSGDRLNTIDGILQWIAIDTGAGGAELDVWGKNNGSPYWTGATKPEHQLYMATSLWQGYASRAVNDVFPVDDGGINYDAFGNIGILAATLNTYADDVMWGVSDCDDRNTTETRPNAPHREFLGEAHDTGRDGFYEIAIPLSWLQITRTDLENNGIGVMMGCGSESAMDSIPHDEATVDTEGVEDWNASFEWGDTDSFTTPFARVGAP